MARLDRLVTAKGITQLGATIGRQFSYALLQAVSQLDTTTLQRELGRLVEAELVYQRGVPPQAHYIFKHALIRDSAYESLLKSTRQQYHQRIAQVLEAQFPETAEAEPELLAHHYTEAGLIEQSVVYWYKAGQRASERSAHAEAIAHLRQGLALLETLPESPECMQQKVDLLIALGASLLGTRGSGAPEVEQTYLRAQHLCEHLHVSHQRFPVLRGLWSCSIVRTELHTAHALGQQLLVLAQQSQEPGMLLAAHRALGSTLFHLGEAVPALTHLAQGMALYDPKRHHASAFLYGEDAGVVCHSFAAWTLWCLGYPEQGLVRSREAVTLAQQVAHPYSLCHILASAAQCYQFRREEGAAQACAEASINLATAQGFPLRKAFGTILHGWALAQQGQAQEGIDQINQGLIVLRATGAETWRPYFLVLLAEAYGMLGQPETGLAVLAEALTLADTMGARWFTAELHRLKGELLLQQNSDNQAEAETCFQHAMTIAQNQGGKAWELRTATSLARLWQQQGKRQEAHDLLAPVYNWFTEGFDTADLMDAKALLDELA